MAKDASRNVWTLTRQPMGARWRRLLVVFPFEFIEFVEQFRRWKFGRRWRERPLVSEIPVASGDGSR